MKRAFFVLLLTFFPLARASQKDSPDFSQWPESRAPRDVGTRIAQRFLDSPHLNWGEHNHFIVYPEVCTWWGALTFAEAAFDKGLTQKLVDRFSPCLLPENAWMIPPSSHVDSSVFGIVPLELYAETKRSQFRQIGLSIADAQWDNPLPDGLTNQTRFWIDDMFMITALQVQAFRATGDRRYIERSAREMLAYLRRLQQPNGLFYHAPDVPYYWGRGNGWVAVGMTELLRSLPKDHPDRPEILAAYRRMMATLLLHQTPEGLWRQLIDRPESWIETSSSAMFDYAFIMGVKEGWLDQVVYGPAARKAWLQLVGYLNDNADLREVCIGTNKKSDFQYYMDRPRVVGDMHGQAAMLWCATALLR